MALENYSVDLTAGRFGSLTVKSFVGASTNKTEKLTPHWKVKCGVCGSETTESEDNLMSGRATSCGCTDFDNAVLT